jgi:hypothetical protein
LISNSKLIKACVLSPVITGIFVTLVYFLIRHADVDNIGEFPTTFTGSVFYILGMSFNFYFIVLVVNVLIGLPFTLFLRKYDLLNLAALGICGTVLGGVILFLIGNEFNILSLAFGGLVGFFVSLTFGLIAGVSLKNK